MTLTLGAGASATISSGGGSAAEALVRVGVRDSVWGAALVMRGRAAFVQWNEVTSAVLAAEIGVALDFVIHERAWWYVAGFGDAGLFSWEDANVSMRAMGIYPGLELGIVGHPQRDLESAVLFCVHTTIAWAEERTSVTVVPFVHITAGYVADWL